MNAIARSLVPLQKSLFAPLFALLLCSLAACNDGAGDETPLIEFPEFDVGVLDDTGDGFTLPDGDDDCLLPCLFGSVCEDGQCVLPCDPECGEGANCQFGVCIPELGAICDPPCTDNETCRGEAEAEGICVSANACEPACDEGETCLRSGGCLPADGCLDDATCSGDERCFGGACVPPIDAADWQTGAATGAVYFVEVPGAVAERCCFDLNGDGIIDNALPVVDTLSALLGSDGIEEGFENAIASGDLGVGVELRSREDGRADVAMYDVSLDLDRDGEPDATLDELESGNASVRIRRSGFGAYGPLSIFYGATDRDEEAEWVAATGDVFISLPPGALLSLSEQSQRYRLQRARLSASLRSGAGGTLEDDGEVRIGGAVAAEDIVSVFNESVRDCVCVSDRAGDLLVVREVENALELDCRGSVSLALCIGGEGACGQLPTLCQALPEASQFIPWDIDTDGDGVRDALSVGFRYAVAPATFAP